MNIVSSVHTRFSLQIMEEGFGPFIKARREAEKLTQAELASLAGIGKSHLSQIEAGKIGLPSADIRRRLAKHLRTTNLELLVAAGELTREEANPDNAKQLDPDTYAIVQRVIEYLNEVRHSGGSIAYRAGIDIKTISERLGHSDAAFTARVYVHLDDAHHKAAADVFWRLIAPPVSECVKSTGDETAKPA